MQSEDGTAEQQDNSSFTFKIIFLLITIIFKITCTMMLVVLLLPTIILFGGLGVILLSELVMCFYNYLSNGFMDSNLTEIFRMNRPTFRTDWVGVDRLIENFMDFAWNPWGRGLIGFLLMAIGGFLSEMWKNLMDLIWPTRSKKGARRIKKI